jgi:hypothetical protein
MSAIFLSRLRLLFRNPTAADRFSIPFLPVETAKNPEGRATPFCPRDCSCHRRNQSWQRDVYNGKIASKV